MHRSARAASAVVRLLWLSALVGVLPPAPAAAENAGDAAPPPGLTEEPLWEIGVFGGVARLPHYRGSDQYEVYALPLPYLIYRGKIFQSDREGVRGIFAATRHFESSLSLGGNPPPRGADRAREGMPELGPVGEAGPSLKWFLQDRGAPRGLCVQAAVRGAVSLDDGRLDYRGLHGGLYLLYDDSRWWDARGFRYGLNFGLDLATSAYNSYFYDVPAQYARADRPAYDAAGGYGGWGCAAYGVRRLTDAFSVGLYARWDNLSGAVFENSPLVLTENNLTLAAALIWQIMQSDTTVPWQRDLSR